MYTRKQGIKKYVQALALLLCAVFLFAGCGGEKKPFEQLCDLNVGIILKLNGLQDSGEKYTSSILISDYESFQSVRDELEAEYLVKLPKVKEKAFEKYTYLLIVHTVSSLKKYEYRVKEVSVDQKTLFVRSELAQDPEKPAMQAEGRRVVLVRLDKELVQDVQNVSVKTEYVDKSFSELS